MTIFCISSVWAWVQWAALFASALTFYIFVPYIRSIRQGQMKPHVFSWVIWGLTTFIVFFAQVAANGGTGALPIGLSGLLTLYIAWLAWRYRGDTSITRIDWAFLIAALAALPAWFIARDPVWAVIVLTTVDLLGFGPTLRKAWNSPHTESPAFYGLFAVRNALVLIALEEMNLATTLFPIAVGIGCIIVVLLLLWRRRVVTQTG
jgi:hypothetical protein